MNVSRLQSKQITANNTKFKIQKEKNGTNNSKKFYQKLSKLKKSPQNGIKGFKSKNLRFAKSEDEVVTIWEEYFKQLSMENYQPIYHYEEITEQNDKIVEEPTLAEENT